MGEQRWGHLCGARMEGVGQLTEKICLARYHQIEHLQCLHPSPPCRTWGERKPERKPGQFSATESQRGKIFKKEPAGGVEKASNISWPRALFSDPLDGCEAIWL